ARSDGEPHRFYYRKQVDQTYWTPWEEIPGKIEYDTPTPVVWQGKLLLVWLVLREVASGTAGDAALDAPGSAPAPYFEARLGWAERRNGGWSKARVSETVVDVVFSAGAPSGREAVGFEIRLEGGALVVQPIARLAGSDDTMFVPVHALVLHGDGRVVRGASSVGEQLKEYSEMVWPKHSDPLYQGHGITAEHELSVPYRQPNEATIQFADVLSLQTDGSTVASRVTDIAGRNVEFSGDAPFFFQDLRRTYLVEPRNVYSPASGSQFGGGFVAVEQTQQHNIGMYVPSQLRLASTPPSPSGAAAVLELAIDAGTTRPMLASQPTWQAKGFDVTCFYHHFMPALVAMVEERGVATLLDPPEHGRWSQYRRQAHSKDFFEAVYDPGPHVDVSEAVGDIDFDRWGAYAVYNWELFFHAPMLVARQLVGSGRYDEARRWLHAVLDPHDASSDPAPARFWQLKPFFEASVPENIADELETLSYAGPDGSRIKRRRALERQIEAWRKNPFEPHLIAQLRPAAYQRYTVMQYLDTLVAWGDALFRQDTLESINEATQLYVLAAQLLGPRPQQVERRSSADLTYAELAPLLDEMSNAIVELENVVPGTTNVPFDFTPDLALTAAQATSSAFPVRLHALAVGDELVVSGPAEASAVHIGPALGIGSFTTTTPIPAQAPTLYFCIPPNEKMLGYWDTVADRLFKIRHCMNLEGITRELPLFEPPIDPALLVRARAAGLDISSALSALSAPLPHHRFRTMIVVAKELCADVRGLGQALVQALERKDAEALAELRAGHERGLLQLVRGVREQQVEEARANRSTLEQARRVAQQRLSFVTTRERRIKEEQSQPQSLARAKADLRSSLMFEQLAAVLGMMPNFTVGISGVASPVLTATAGGSTYAMIYGAIARHLASVAQGKQIDASIAGIQASLIRRDEEWTQEAALAELELERIDRELAAIDIRIALAESELANHDRQVRNAEDVEAFLRERFTNAELYGQMASEIGRVYFAAYQLAFDLAKQAERAYQYELAAPSATFVEFGYWDNQRKGLLAGDKLMHDLRRMEVAYLEHNRRELELGKLVSLALVDPMALELLRDIGTCFFRVPEVLFDLDHPGHYLRRIKSVAVTLPLVEGAHGNVTGMLTLVESSVRRSPSLTEPAVADPTADMQQIGLSTGNEDAGLFERSYADERRLPFEGRGAASLWRLELPGAFRQFDYRDISDVVLRIAYTARNGGEVLRNEVVAGIEAALASFAHAVGNGQVRYLSLSAHFAEAWAAFAAASGPQRVLEIDLAAVHFPVLLTPGTIRVGAAWVVTRFVDTPVSLAFAATMPTSDGATLDAAANVSTVLSAAGQAAALVRHGALTQIPAMVDAQPTTGRWRISIAAAALPDVGVLHELGLLLQYTVVQ
ncbi:MAG: hypothetical protein IAG13_28155, partial [Deltaproteobacteria bacterium]|nr:hypothetical protein [Nannocystaceae bacterium]